VDFFERRFGHRLGWYLLFRLMLTPMAAIAPVVSCGAAITFGSLFGRWGGLLGGLFGLALGVVLVFVWYMVIVGKVEEHRERAFERRLYEDVEKGLLRPRREPEKAPEAIPITTSPSSPVDLETDVGTAIARIEVHAERDPSGAVIASEVLRARHPRDARVAATLARMLYLAGRPNEALTRASEALHMAALTGHMGPATRLCIDLWEARDGLVLEASIARTLARSFEEAGDEEKAAHFRALAET
jgi:hypothetical protein